jgi:PIN domain nuclease of toxin-antitoxin system
VTPLAFDSSTLIAWLVRERGWTAVDRVLAQSDDIVLPAPGLCEVIRIVRRRGNTSSGRLIADALSAQGIVFVAPDSDDLVAAADLLERSDAMSGRGDGAGGFARIPHSEAGRGRASLSVADALILTVADRLRRPVVTRDRYWLELADAGLVRAQVHVF